MQLEPCRSSRKNTRSITPDRRCTRNSRRRCSTRVEFHLSKRSSKSGKTASGIIWLLEKALHGKPGQNFWWVAPVVIQSMIAFNRMRRAINPRESYFARLTDRTITLREQETTIAFRSGDHPDTLYGEDVYACIIDEASRFKEESWHAIR